MKVGDFVGVREKSKSLNIIVEAKGKDSSVYEWLSWNSDQLQGTFVNVPERLQIPENIKEQLIVELYLNKQTEANYGNIEFSKTG